VSFLPYGNRKAVKKTCRGHVFRPWEIPSFRECSRYGCKTETIYGSPKRHTPLGVCLFCHTGIERPLRKRAGGTFLGRGRFHRFGSAAGTAVKPKRFTGHQRGNRKAVKSFLQKGNYAKFIHYIYNPLKL